MSDRLPQLLALHDKDPRDPFLTYGIALEHGKAGRLEEALTWPDKTLALDGAYCYAWYQKGKILVEAGQVEQAKAALKAGMAAAGLAGDGHAADELATLLESLE